MTAHHHTSPIQILQYTTLQFSTSLLTLTSVVLLDSGSQVNFIYEKLVNILQLPKKQFHTYISGLNQIKKKL